jgi:hypothetical protein
MKRMADSTEVQLYIGFVYNPQARFETLDDVELDSRLVSVVAHSETEAEAILLQRIATEDVFAAFRDSRLSVLPVPRDHFYALGTSEFAAYHLELVRYTPEETLAKVREANTDAGAEPAAPDADA